MLRDADEAQDAVQAGVPRRVPGAARAARSRVTARPGSPRSRATSACAASGPHARAARAHGRARGPRRRRARASRGRAPPRRCSGGRSPTLPQRQREAVVLREFGGRSYDQVASELGVSTTAVESLLFRARELRGRLRAALAALNLAPLPRGIGRLLGGEVAPRLASPLVAKGAAVTAGLAVLGGGAVATERHLDRPHPTSRRRGSQGRSRTPQRGTRSRRRRGPSRTSPLGHGMIGSRRLPFRRRTGARTPSRSSRRRRPARPRYGRRSPELRFRHQSSPRGRRVPPRPCRKASRSNRLRSRRRPNPRRPPVGRHPPCRARTAWHEAESSGHSGPSDAGREDGSQGSGSSGHGRSVMAARARRLAELGPRRRRLGRGLPFARRPPELSAGAQERSEGPGGGVSGGDDSSWTRRRHNGFRRLGLQRRTPAARAQAATAEATAATPRAAAATERAVTPDPGRASRRAL